MKWKKTMMIIAMAVYLGVGIFPFPKVYAMQTEIDDTKESANTGDTAIKELFIDNHNVYEGMEKSYSKGYVPKIEKDKAIIVLPLLIESELKRNQIKTSVNLGTGDTIPFVYKNYEKDVKRQTHKLSKKGNTAKCYLVTYELELKKDRMNGSYPVIINVSATDTQGNNLRQDFTVYVTITDGIAIGSTTDGEITANSMADNGITTEETPQFAPKVMVNSYKCSKETIFPGEEFTMDIELLNTSKTDTIKNMMVTTAPEEMLELVSSSDSIYLESLGAEKTELVSFAFKINGAAPQGQYNIPITMDYADSRGNTYTAQGMAKVIVEQPVKLEIDPVIFPKEIQIGETVELTVQTMNLGRGKLYNVRAMAQADGLNFTGTAFIGDIEAGTAMSGSTEVVAVGLSGNSLYGATKGTVTFYYEDETGKEMQEELNFETTILSPLSEEKERDAEDNTSQWWVIMTVIVGILLVAAVLFVVRRLKEMKRDAEDP